MKFKLVPRQIKYTLVNNYMQTVTDVDTFVLIDEESYVQKAIELLNSKITYISVDIYLVRNNDELLIANIPK